MGTNLDTTFVLLKHKSIKTRYALFSSSGYCTDWRLSLEEALSSPILPIEQHSISPENLKLILEGKIHQKFPSMKTLAMIKSSEYPTMEYLTKHHPELFL